MIMLIMNRLGQHEIYDRREVPRVGDKVDIFYHPYPTVTNVLWFPSTKTLNELGITVYLDAIVTVE